MKKTLLSIFVIGPIVIIFIYFFHKQEDLLRPLSISDNYVDIEIDTKNPEKVVSKLRHNKLIRDDKALLKYISENNIKFNEGNYYLSREMRSDTIAKVISGKEKRNIDFSISLNDTIHKILPKIQSVLKRTNNNIESLFKSKSLIKTLSNKYDFIEPNKMIKDDIEYYLEGYLFIGDYKLNLYDSDEKILQSFLDYTQKMYTKYKSEINNKKLSFHKLISLTSCLNAEAGKYTEQYKDIAGIYWNRLNISMPLQLDATFIYGYNHGKKTRSKDANISLKKMRIEDLSDYNTYEVTGSPIGGITSISETALNAILHPNKNEYKFYFHYTENGIRKVEYSKTYEEHLSKMKG